MGLGATNRKLPNQVLTGERVGFVAREALSNPRVLR